ncbi:MAG: AraC family transcriptional regulator, partial [Thermomicrobiales bacterium]
LDEDQRRQVGLAELTARIAGRVPDDDSVEVLPGVRLNRDSQAAEVGHSVSTPVLCLIAQGVKEWLLGDRTYRYDRDHYLIATAELPVATRVVEATPEAPYLGVVIALDPDLVRSVILETGHMPGKGPVAAVDMGHVDAELLDAVVRLVRLAETPEGAPFLAPLIKREIIYRLLEGNQGDRLWQGTRLAGSGHRIVEGIQRIRREYDRPLRIEDQARDLGMSSSAFHLHFKAVTGMSPLAFQKQLRLQEARRLMLGEGVDAAGAGIAVGYRDVSQFTREYKRVFGAPPATDVAQARHAMQLAGSR